MKASVILVLLVVVHGTTASSWWKTFFGFEVEKKTVSEPPAFCRGRECPDFKVVHKYDGYELREYIPSVWVTVQTPSTQEDYWEDDNCIHTIFAKLYHYIEGENDRNQTIEMTAPVVLSHAQKEVFMNFMIPKELAANPPKPTDPDVSIYRHPTKSQYYVRSFGGFPYGFFGYNYFKDEFVKLESALKKDLRSYDADTMFFTAGYDAPWNLFHRHNEVWIPKK